MAPRESPPAPSVSPLVRLSNKCGHRCPFCFFCLKDRRRFLVYQVVCSLFQQKRTPTVDGRNPAPPKTPWNDDSPVNTNKPMVKFQPCFKVVRNGFRNHPQLWVWLWDQTRTGGSRSSWPRPWIRTASAACRSSGRRRALSRFSSRENPGATGSGVFGEKGRDPPPKKAEEQPGFCCLGEEVGSCFGGCETTRV